MKRRGCENMKSCSAAQPHVGQDRIVTLGILRGFALLGILVINVQSLPVAAYANPLAFG